MCLEFYQVSIGRLFRVAGNDWVKQSSRTAKMLSNGRTFYFKKNEPVHLISW